MSDLNISGFRFSEADVKKVLTSPEGKKLLQLLSQDGGKALRQAADALKNGQSRTAQQILSPIMESEAAAGLIKKLNQE